MLKTLVSKKVLHELCLLAGSDTNVFTIFANEIIFFFYSAPHANRWEKGKRSNSFFEGGLEGAGSLNKHINSLILVSRKGGVNCREIETRRLNMCPLG